MFNQTSFNKFLDFGKSPNPLSLDHAALAEFGIDIPLYESLHLLKKIPIPPEIECPFCDDYAEISISFQEEGSVIRAQCPQCGVFIPEQWMTERWTPDFSAIMQALYQEFHCSEEMVSMIPHSLWKLGRSAISGQSREIFIAAGINSWRNPSIVQMLPENKTSILIVFGEKPEKGCCGTFPDDRIFSISSLASLKDGKITVDISPVKEMCNLLTSLHEPCVRGPGKFAKVGDTTQKLISHLRTFMHGVYCEMEQAERSGRTFKFIHITQKQLAEMINVQPVMVCRAIKRNNLLQGLFEAANNPKTAYSYGLKMEMGKI